MIGQIEVINWLICVYLCYKGFEILQRAILSDKPDKKFMLIVSWILFIVSIIIAVGTFVFMELYVGSIGNSNF